MSCGCWYIRVDVCPGGLKGIPQLSAFRAWLMAEFDQGNLNRQEAVSMLPTLLLDVQPHHITLDMCAAPGSKTAQILEDIHNKTAQPTATDGAAPPNVRGMVIANDSDPQRAYMLVHQLKRLGSPAFLVTTHEGQHFPNLYTARPHTTAEHTSTSAAPQTAAVLDDGSSSSSHGNGDALLHFDRILCDVPCSGDGTLRKNLRLWSKWTPQIAYGLHPLQVAIAWRGLQMLRVGGLMVYSTCAFNPVEDEAVVAELLRRSRGAVTLVDCADKLPGLKRCEGKSSWVPTDAQSNPVLPEEAANSNKSSVHSTVALHAPHHNCHAAQPRSLSSAGLCAAAAGCASRLRYPSSVFPPSSAEAATFNLSRCLRLLPHHQDTGGFFIALLNKHAELPNVDRDREGSNTAASNQQQTSSDHSTDDTAAFNNPQQAVSSNSHQMDSNVAVGRQMTALDEHTMVEEHDVNIQSTLPSPTSAPSPAAASSASPPHSAQATSRRLVQPSKEKRGFSDDPFLPINEQVARQIMSAVAPPLLRIVIQQRISPKRDFQPY